MYFESLSELAEILKVCVFSNCSFLCLAPRKAREENFNAERAPRDPPFTAYIANLSYDVDTETVMEFFGHLNIKGMDFLLLPILHPEMIEQTCFYRCPAPS